MKEGTQARASEQALHEQDHKSLRYRSSCRVLQGQQTTPTQRSLKTPAPGAPMLSRDEWREHTSPSNETLIGYHPWCKSEGRAVWGLTCLRGFGGSACAGGAGAQSPLGWDLTAALLPPGPLRSTSSSVSKVSTGHAWARARPSKAKLQQYRTVSSAVGEAKQKKKPEQLHSCLQGPQRNDCEHTMSDVASGMGSTPG